MRNFNVSYNRIYFQFLWTWIRDKQIKHVGDEEQGMLIIYEEDGRVVGMWGYESINTKEE